MNAKTFAKWMRLQGRKVIRTRSSYWYNAGPRVFQAFPLHWLIQPSRREMNALMIRHSVAAVRYSKPLDATEGIASYHAVLNGPYNLEMLRHQARNGVRKGLKHFQIERISFNRLADEGWKLQQDTLERQDRTSSMNQSDWQRICLAADGLPGFEAWGAIVDGELAASMLTSQIDNIWYIPYAQSSRKFLSKHVNNALFFTVSCELLSRNGITGLFFCLHSLDAPPSVDDFKWRMNYIAKPVRQQVEFHPLLSPIANYSSHSLLLQLLERYPGSHVLSKAEGMLRFYLEGKKPLNEQEWPECLCEYQLEWEKVHGRGSATKDKNLREPVDIQWVAKREV
jgi:hypothetical protein